MLFDLVLTVLMLLIQLILAKDNQLNYKNTKLEFISFNNCETHKVY